MNFIDLFIFKSIYKNKSINKAAQELGYTQSNLTARLKLIENEFNTQFFIRNYDGVKVTSSGQQMFEFVNSTLLELDILKNSIKNEKSKLLISELLLNFIVNSDKEFSFNSFEITVKKTSEISDEINKNFYNEVFSFNKLKTNNYQLLEKKELIVCFLQGKNKKGERLPIVINKDELCPLRQLTKKLVNCTDELIEIDSLENILQLIRNGSAIALLPRYLVGNDYEKYDHNDWKIEYFHYSSIY
jgi:hypothetical protein